MTARFFSQRFLVPSLCDASILQAEASSAAVEFNLDHLLAIDDITRNQATPQCPNRTSSFLLGLLVSDTCANIYTPHMSACVWVCLCMYACVSVSVCVLPHACNLATLQSDLILRRILTLNLSRFRLQGANQCRAACSLGEFGFPPLALI